MPALDIGFFQGEHAKPERLFARLSAFPIESLITRPSQWVSYKQDILASDKRVLGLVLFKMLLLVNTNYTDYQNQSHKTFQNVQSTKSLLMKVSNKTSNNTSVVETTYNKHLVINNTDHMANKPKSNKQKQIRFNLEEEGRPEQEEKARNMKKQQLA